MLNLTRMKYRFIIIASICLCGAFFFAVGHNVQALTDNFDDYAVGDIDGKGTWSYDSGGHNFSVTAAKSLSAPNSLLLSSGSASGYIATQTLSGIIQTQCFDINIDGDFGVADTIVIEGQTSTSTYVYAIEIKETATSTYAVYSYYGSILMSGTFSASTWNEICVRNDVYNGFRVKLNDSAWSAYEDNASGGYFAQFEINIGNLDVSAYLEDFNDFVIDDYTEAEVITPEDLFGSSTVLILGLDSGFEYIYNTYCYIGGSFCGIKYNYGPNFIDATVILTEYPVATTIVDSTVLTGDSPMTGYLIPTTRSTIQNDEYNIFIERSTGSTSLSDVITIHWIASTTDEVSAGEYVVDFLSKIFPFSLYMQAKRMLTDRLSDISIGNRANITLGDITPEETGLYSTSSEIAIIFSADLISDNFLFIDKHWNTFRCSTRGGNTKPPS